MLQSNGDPDLTRIRTRCQMFDNLQLNSSVLAEEQERELAPEIEQQREDQRPPAAKAAAHDLHPDLTTFVSTGVLATSSSAVLPAFRALEVTSAVEGFNIQRLAKKCSLLATQDYVNTIQTTANSHNLDLYQRPVSFLLRTIKRDDRFIVISPFEANGLLPALSSSKHVQLSIFSSRINKDYRSMDLLEFYNFPDVKAPKVPRAVRIELNIFSGTLYLRKYSDYVAMCDYFGLAAESTPEGWKVAADGFILRDGNGRLGGTSCLEKSPVGFLKALMMRIRSDSEDIGNTHVGGMLSGRLLSKDEFEVQD